MSDVKSVIESGRAVLGIEFGSTRIKAVLIGEDHAPIATGAHDWENMLVDGIWTYSLDMIWEGISDCYSKMAQDAKEKYGVTIKKLAAIGISGMMHGYLPFDKEDNLLVPFRTWRNTITGEAAAELTEVLVEKRMALAFPVLRIERLAGVISIFSASSPKDIFLRAIIMSRFTIII